MTMITVHNGDCLDVLASLPEFSIDAVVTDPPYELGFMGKSWDASGVAFSPDTWRQVMRVLKPGGHMVAFGAPKNYHRLACAIEDAGFEVRDSLMWVFGSGFPKSYNVGQSIEKLQTIGKARRPDRDLGGLSRDRYSGDVEGKLFSDTGGAVEYTTKDGKKWEGWGTALKPAYEPIVLARKPLSEGTVAANVLRWGTGALNIDATRIEGADAQEGRVRHGGGIKGAGTSYELPDYKAPMPAGRWPANFCHDGSQEVVDLFPQNSGANGGRGKFKQHTWLAKESEQDIERDKGSAARFFYCAKANKHDRAGSKHPTVKPVALMQWLVRMVTPPGGTILDPFAGSGTTGQAAINEAVAAILIEREKEYYDDIMRRIA